MTGIVYAKSFLRSAKKLPIIGRGKLARLLELFRKNPFHFKLHTKGLVGELSGLYSFRITRDWRVVFKFLSPAEIQLLEVADRKDIYR